MTQVHIDAIPEREKVQTKVVEGPTGGRVTLPKDRYEEIYEGYCMYNDEHRRLVESQEQVERLVNQVKSYRRMDGLDYKDIWLAQEEQKRVARGMILWGAPWIKRLGSLIRHATLANATLLKKTFLEDWERYNGHALNTEGQQNERNTIPNKR